MVMVRLNVAVFFYTIRARMCTHFKILFDVRYHIDSNKHTLPISLWDKGWPNAIKIGFGIPKYLTFVPAFIQLFSQECHF